MAMLGDLLDRFVDPALRLVPLWGIGLILIGLCLVAREVGAFIYRHRRDDELAQKTEAESHIVGAVLGLLAFVVGLTFSIAIDRYDARRALVTEEANAISAAYLRASLFDDLDRTRLQTTIRQYAHTRIAPDGLWNAKMEAQVARGHALRDQLWSDTRTAVWPVRQTELGFAMVEAVNGVLNTGTRRELSGVAHLPTRIVEIMLIYLIVSAAILGYLLRGRTGGLKHASTVLFVLFTIVIMLILDLDRPRSGDIKVPQRAMIELVAWLDRQPVQAPPAPP